MDPIALAAIIAAAGAIIIGIFNHIKHSSCCGVDIENFEPQQPQPQPQQAPTRIIEIVEPSYQHQDDNDIYNRRHNRPPTRPNHTQYDINARMHYSS